LLFIFYLFHYVFIVNEPHKNEKTWWRCQRKVVNALCTHFYVQWVWMSDATTTTIITINCYDFQFMDNMLTQQISLWCGMTHFCAQKSKSIGVCVTNNSLLVKNLLNFVCWCDFISVNLHAKIFFLLHIISQMSNTFESENLMENIYKHTYCTFPTDDYRYLTLKYVINA
jgi:hypothetical protein